MKLLRLSYQSLTDLVFPLTCASCSCSTNSTQQFICDWCRRKRFERAGFGHAGLLPTTILSRYALWEFDKGGYLQQLLHRLKYDYIRGVGVELGTLLAQQFIKDITKEIEEYIDAFEPVLVPVPLHPSRRRKRGYNQARAVAVGIQKVTNWKLIPRETIIRTRKTKTQTGLTSAQRTKNMNGAFSTPRSGIFDHKTPVLVDDVFTTGSTTFELARTIKQQKNQKALILTIASA